MDWDDVRVFLAAHRARSLVAAASELDMDRTTVGRRIAALEARLGATLFVRTRDGLRPTAAAERLALPAERMAVEAKRLEREGVDDAGVAHGRVRIATTEGFAIFLAQHALAALRAKHPRLDVELLGGNRPMSLLAGEAEVALRLTAVREEGVRVRRLPAQPVALAASRGYLDARGTPRSVRGLAGHDLLVPSGELARLPEVKVLESAEGGRVALRSNSLPALVGAAVKGLGIVALTSSWIGIEPGIERLFDLEGVPPRPLFLAFRADEAKRPAVRAVIDHLATFLSGRAAR